MKKNLNNYAFIDSQNLNSAIKAQGWKLDLKKFRFYLCEKHKVTKAFMFIGYIKEYQEMYDFLIDAGYILIFKPVVITKENEIKGNIDAELVLHTMIEYPNYDKAIIVSGDGDFRCLVEYLDSKNKLEALLIPNHTRYSSLLRKFRKKFIYVSYLKTNLELKKRRSNLWTKP